MRPSVIICAASGGRFRLGSTRGSGGGMGLGRARWHGCLVFSVVCALWASTVDGTASSMARSPSTAATPHLNLYQPSPVVTPPAAQALPASPTPPLSNYVPRVHNQSLPMKPATLDLSPDANATFLGSDGRLEVDADAGTIGAADVAAAGGPLHLLIRQIAPASGGN